MKNFYFASILALLLLPVSELLAQSHLGFGAELFVPLKPYSVGYKKGYGVSFMYRKFEMTRPLILDVSIGYRFSPAKDSALVKFDYSGQPDYRSFYNVRSFYAKYGMAWAFVPNASPYTQPYAGFEVGLGAVFEGDLFNGAEYAAAMRLGWMTYVNERFLFGLEAKYNIFLNSAGAYNDYYTHIGQILAHQLSLQLTTNIRLGK